MNATLPRILVIDDQLGSDADLRDEFCRKLGLIEAQAGRQDRSNSEAVAFVTFCAGQRNQGGEATNSIDIAERAVLAGWPADSGRRWALVLLDLRFDSSLGRPEDEYFGLQVLERLVSVWPDQGRPGSSEIPIVVLSSIERSRYGGRSNRIGAADYVEKSQLDREKLRQLLWRYGLLEDSGERLVGSSLALLRVLRAARRASSEARGNLLILGEKGTGKSMLAHYIHTSSARRSAPFQSITVSPGMEPNALKAQLFGYWCGGYISMDKSEPGLAERAHEGVLFIDEIANLPAGADRDLLEFARLDSNHRGLRRLNRLGAFPSAPMTAIQQANESICGVWDADTQSVLADVFLIAATNKPLDDKAFRTATGFSDDLFARLGEEYGGPIRFPSLRERKDDIAPLFLRFLKDETSLSGGVWPKVITSEVFEAIRSHSWPGNVAELAGIAREVEQESRPWDEVLLRHLPILSAPNVAEDSWPRPALDSEQKQGDLDLTESLARLPGIRDAARILETVVVQDSRKDLEGSLKTLAHAYGLLLERLLSAALDLTRDRSSRERDELLGDLSPTRAISLLMNESFKTDKAADEIKRLVALLPFAPAPETDLGRVSSWATNLRKGGKRTPKKD